MSRRTRPQSKTDDLAFPVRMKLAIPKLGFGGELHTMTIWLRENVGPGYFAETSTTTISGSAHAIHFVDPVDAVRFREAFPHLALADGTRSPAYTSPTKRAEPLAQRQ